MVEKRKFIYHVNQHDELIYVNDHWCDFAQENDAQHLVSEDIFGSPIWDYIVDPETINLYQAVFEKVKKSGSTLRFPFRCDSPDLRRFMELTVSRIEEGIRLTGHVIRLEKRDNVLLLSNRIKRSNEHIRICGWCKKVDIDNKWFEVEDAIHKLGLFNSSALPQLDHVMCDSCYESNKID